MVETEITKVILHLVLNKEEEKKINPQIREDSNNLTIPIEEPIIESLHEERKDDLFKFSLEYSLYEEFEDTTKSKEKTNVEITSDETEILIKNPIQHRMIFKFHHLTKEYSCMIFKNKTCHIYLFIGDLPNNKSMNYHIYIKNWTEELHNLPQIPNIYFKTSLLLDSLSYVVLFNFQNQKVFSESLWKKITQQNIKLCYYYNNEKEYITRSVHLISSFYQPSILFNDVRQKIMEIFNNFEKELSLIKDGLSTIKNNMIYFEKEHIQCLVIKMKTKIKEEAYFKTKFTDIKDFTDDDYNIYCSYLKYKIYRSLYKSGCYYKLLMRRLELFQQKCEELKSKTKENLQLLCFYYFIIKTEIIEVEDRLEEWDTISFPLEDNNDDKKHIKNNYQMAKAFIRNIINNLTEKSLLFTCALQMNSPMSKDLLFNKTCFELHYIPLVELKNHLNALSELRIARYFLYNEVTGFTNHIGNYVCFNEGDLCERLKRMDIHGVFDHTIQLSIVMFLIHELFGRTKIKYSKTKSKNPKEFFLNDTFDSFDIRDRPGKYAEKYISSDPGFLDYLECCDDKIANDLLNVELWIKPNFTEIYLKSQYVKIPGAKNRTPKFTGYACYDDSDDEDGICEAHFCT